MKSLKISTGGSVDAGKSTLIGRLLLDTDSLSADKVEEMKSASRGDQNCLDLSLAVDGLLAERDQGITIDVAHIYFASASKSYVIADTPGHFEYTQNMVTGASSSQAALILIDVRVGIEDQTYRHFFINNLMRTNVVVVAVNKMDLVGFSKAAFEEIKRDFKRIIEKRNFLEQRITFIPVSAISGDNVVHRSKMMPWFDGPSILQYFENLNLKEKVERGETGKMRFPVQHVIDKSYAGKVYGGDLHVGDEIEVLPSRRKSKIKGIHVYDKQYQKATPGSSVLLILEDDIDLVRGDMIVNQGQLPFITKAVLADICWMGSTPLNVGGVYDLQHGLNTVRACVTAILHKMNLDYSGIEKNIKDLNMNEIGSVQLRLDSPIFPDPFDELPSNGAFILIDPQSHNTIGVGFIRSPKHLS